MTDIYKRFTDYVTDVVLQDSRGWNFKRHDDFTYMLEHVMPDMGEAYLQLIEDHYTYNANKDLYVRLCRMNDIYGQPRRFDFEDFLYTSCTNLRYIYFSLLILDHVKKLGRTEIDIVEIGGGYGGLCFFLSNIAKVYGIEIKTYSLFDLQAPLYLQEQYLGLLKVKNTQFLSLDGDLMLSPDSILVSTYSFSEIEQDIRDKYVERVLPFCTHGFIAWNNIPFYDFIDADFVVEDEQPLTTFSKNRFVYF